MNSTPGPPTDQDLIHQASRRDRDAFGDLYERYLEAVYRYCCHRLRSAQEAEDLTEQIFLKVWEYLTGSRQARPVEHFRAWLFRIARNAVIDHTRKQQPEAYDPATLAAVLPGAGSAEDEAQCRNSLQRLHAALDQLDETGREIITLRFLAGLRHQEVARILGLQEGHVRVLQYRALKQLRMILEEADHD